MHKMESLKIKNILVDRLICDKCKSALVWDGTMYSTYPP